MPTAKPASVGYGRYQKAADEFVREDLCASRVPSWLERLKVSYGRLGRRPRFWGPRSRWSAVLNFAPTPRAAINSIIGPFFSDNPIIGGLPIIPLIMRENATKP